MNDKNESEAQFWKKRCLLQFEYNNEKEKNLTSFYESLLHAERSKREDRYIGGYFPPPWNPDEHPEKTEGWIAFQEEQRKDPRYYGCGALNTSES